MLSGPFLFTDTLDWFHWQQSNVKVQMRQQTCQWFHTQNTRHLLVSDDANQLKHQLNGCHKYLTHIQYIHTHKWTIASRIYCCYNNLLSLSNIQGKWFIRLHKIHKNLFTDRIEQLDSKSSNIVIMQFLIFVQYEITSSMF